MTSGEQSRADAVIARNLDRARRPDYYRALRQARLIDAYDVQAAGRCWTRWAGQAGIEVEAAPPDVGQRCVATLNGTRYHAGVIVAVVRGEPPSAGVWVWLVDGGPPSWKLHQPLLRFAREQVEIVRRKDDAE